MYLRYDILFLKRRLNPNLLPTKIRSHLQPIKCNIPGFHTNNLATIQYDLWLHSAEKLKQAEKGASVMGIFNHFAT